MIDSDLIKNVGEIMNDLAEKLITRDNATEADADIAQQLLDLSTALILTSEKAEEAVSYLRIFATFSKVANLSERNEQVADYDEDLAQVLQEAAKAVIEWDDNE